MNLLEMIRSQHLEGYEDPFGCMKVQSSQNSYDSSTTAHRHKYGTYPTMFLLKSTIINSDDSGESFKLASSNDSLLRNVANIMGMQAARATTSESQAVEKEGAAQLHSA